MPPSSSIADLVQRELAAMNASNAQDLVPGASDRALLAGPPTVLPIGDGRTSLVQVLLAPGAPSRLRVPTGLSLKFSVRTEPNGSMTILARPDRADVQAAVTLAISGESRALEAASNALIGAGVSLPPSARRWPDALIQATLDPRLPRAQFVGGPSWMLMFEPHERGAGPNAVLLDANSFAVQNVQAR